MALHKTNLIKRYIAAAEGYAACIRNGDSEGSDVHFDEIERTFSELKALGRDGLDQLAALLEADDEGVRLWASSHLLNCPEYGSLKVLEDITQSSSILALTAEMTLDQWRNGRSTY